MTASTIPYVSAGFSLNDFIRHLLNPKGQSAVVRTTLPEGYHDSTDRLLHAAFQVLVDYVERECALEELMENPEEHGMTLSQHVYVRNEALGVLFLTRRALDVKHGTPEEQEHMRQEETLARNLLYLYNWWTNIRPSALAHLDETFYDIEKEDQTHLEMLISLRTKEWF